MVALYCALTAEQVYAEMNWEILHRACALLTKKINRQIKQEKEKTKQSRKLNEHNMLATRENDQPLSPKIEEHFFTGFQRSNN